MARRYQHIEESIYDLIPQPEARQIKPPMHRSRYPHDTAPTASTFGSATRSQIGCSNLGGQYQDIRRVHDHKQSGGTMGKSSRHYGDPTNFRKKQSGHAKLTKPQKFTYSSKVKPPVVTLKEAKTWASQNRKQQERKDYITQNAMAVITAEPRRPKSGSKQYTAKKNYGKSPSYLRRVNKEIEMEKEYVRQVMERENQATMAQQPRMRQLPEEERIQLLDDLKQKWCDVNKEYQLGAHLVNLDTLGKKRRKERHEAQLKQLEAAIEKLSRSPVFVQDEQQY
jgi:hypothetical protein